jgi:hypothetical protein
LLIEEWSALEVLEVVEGEISPHTAGLTHIFEKL